MREKTTLRINLFTGLLGCLWILGCTHATPVKTSGRDLLLPHERYFNKIHQLTFGGTNAEAYWSFDGDWLTFQHKGPGLLGEIPDCDQIYKMKRDGTEVQRLSSGQGRTTCPFFFPNFKRTLFSTTESYGPGCPPPPDMSRGYVWSIYPTYQIIGVKQDGSDPIPLEPASPRAYNAETTVCHDGSVIFTSDRSGDLELYRATMDSFGSFKDIRQITHTPGYDGGAVFSPDCKKIAWRASRPRPGKEMDEYEALLEEHLVKPKELEIWVADEDGTHSHQVTQLGAASFAPTFTPDGKRILFSSNFRSPGGHGFDLYLINTNGTDLEPVTLSNGFEAFPMFSPDGKYLAFSSQRNAKAPHETNVFVAEWADQPSPPLSIRSTARADRFLALVQLLAAPEMEGRGPGLAGLAKAEDLVADRFSAIGLRPFYSVFPDHEDPNSYKMPVEIQLSPEKKVTTNNVVGVWGQGCKTSKPIVVGAHLDHLGRGSSQSLEPNQIGIHPGADDNASGVAAMIEASRVIAANPKAKQSCFIFAAFTGEELGIIGSSRFVALLKKLHLQPKAMLNLDMVGRMENNTLIAFGSDSAQEWDKILSTECSARHLNCPGGGDGYGPSDHMAFYIANTPVLHFFTGPHLDYHRTTDTADKINATGGIQAAEVVAAVALKASQKSQGLHYKKPSAKPMMGSLTGKEKRSSGAYLGTIPDYSTLMSPHGPGGGGAEGGGVKLAGVRPGAPADKAGVRAGDILKSIQAYKILTLQDFTDALVNLKPGDTVTLAITRDGKPMSLTAVLGKRQ